MSRPLTEIADEADLLLFNALLKVHSLLERVDGGAIKVNRAARAKALDEATNNITRARGVVRSFMSEEKRAATSGAVQ